MHYAYETSSDQINHKMSYHAQQSYGEYVRVQHLSLLSLIALIYSFNTLQMIESYALCIFHFYSRTAHCWMILSGDQNANNIVQSGQEG